MEPERSELGGIPGETLRRERAAGAPREPIPRDGRYLDERSAVLEGEASGQRVERLDASALSKLPFEGIPSQSGYNPEDPTYYGIPVLKEPVWIWTVPAYFHVGGVAGVAGALGTALENLGSRELWSLARRCDLLALVGTVAGSGLLVADLGRPERFLAMLRVFRPSSPMSVGSWVLAANSGAAFAAFVLPDGWLRRLFGLASAPLGALQATYTAVLLNCTAVEVWANARRSMPPLFAASSLAGVASLMDLLPLSETEHEVMHPLGVLGKSLELAAGAALELEVQAAHPRAVRPLREGLSGFMWQAARVCTAASLALSLWPGKARWKRVASGVLGTVGAAGVRFALLRAGHASARDPRATFHRQRRRDSSRAVDATGSAGALTAVNP